VDPRLGVQGRRRALPHPRRGAEERCVAAGDARPVRASGEHVRRPGRVLAAALAARSTPAPSRGAGERRRYSRGDGTIVPGGNGPEPSRLPGAPTGAAAGVTPPASQPNSRSRLGPSAAATGSGALGNGRAGVLAVAVSIN